MFASTLTSLAVIGVSARAVAASAGSAHVVNKCSYDVYLCNVPAADGGYEQSEEYIKSGDSWSQDWTQLSNNDGWSIKLSKDNSLANILQYEYTFHNDGTIWYDLSCVNGNPWDGNWEITSSTSSCTPKQAAYRFATDDAFGMQSCPSDASITVTLCSGESSDNGTSDQGSDDSQDPAPVAIPTPAQAAPVYTSAPAYTAPAPAATYAYNWNNEDVSASLNPDMPAVATPTTFATQVTEVAVASDGAVVNAVETVYVTDYVDAPASKPKARRHEHHPHHRHA